MRRIGQNRVNQPSTQSVEKTKSNSVETQKPVQEKQKQEQEKKHKPLSEGVKGQRRTDKQYSGLMKRVMVDSKAQGQQQGQQWKPGAKPGTTQPQQPQTGQNWVKGEPTKQPQ